uniref:Putative cramped protein n=1 Tax=Culex tarsalis TaxID=7177 RepID=A0A1Q3F181_CULTA
MAVVTNFNEVFKSPNASNESLDMAKDIEVCSDGECGSAVVKLHPVLGTGSDASLDGGPDLKSPESNDSLRLAGVSKLKVELESGVSIGENSNDGNGSETEPTVSTKQEEASGEDLIKTTVKRKDSKEKCGKRKDSKSGSMTGLSSLHFRPLISEETIQRVREGWTMQNVGDLTVGDLYIMFGEENRLQLEYGWVQPRVVKTEQVESINGVEPLEGSGVQEIAVTNGTSGNEDGGGILNETVVLSGRLRQLLQIANLSEKTGKRRCPCGHVCDRRIKMHDQLPGASISSDNSLFKTPKVPNRNGNAAIAVQANCNLVPSPHAAYKQTRWFRMRVNRHQLPSHRVMLASGGGGGGHYLPSRNTNNNSPKLTSSNNSSTNGSASPSSGYQSATSSSSSSNGTSSGASSIRRPDDDSLTKLLEDKITSFQSGSSKKSGNLTSSPGEESSSLSLFDISLPSTSSSLLADLMGSETRNPSEEREENSNVTTISTTKILRETADGGELVETDINDISLSSFLGHLDAVYESEAAVTARRREGDQMNISIISESSVDYIARFEDIAAELRAQQQAQEQQQQQQQDSIAEIEVHRS